mmetsp:Transcript_53887/g.98521  ORF Transcript_53887/g.98521 Transcript_53887/m.98521 type:complete len:304 (+) Transcript_53887:25-936(+)
MFKCVQRPSLLMYNLRLINNIYAESAQAAPRGDLIIVSHPEFVNGRIESEKRRANGWDHGKAPGLKRKRPVHGLTSMKFMNPKGAQAGLHERALAKAEAKAMARAQSAPSLSQKPARPMAIDSLESFLDALATTELEHAKPAHGCASSVIHPSAPPMTGLSGPGDFLSLRSPVQRNVQWRRSELVSFQALLRRDPGAAQRELADRDKWKFYAQILSQASLKSRHDSATAHPNFVILGTGQPCPGDRPSTVSIASSAHVKDWAASLGWCDAPASGPGRPSSVGRPSTGGRPSTVSAPVRGRTLK